MKAPNKIYVASYNGEAFSHSWTMEPLGDTTATEYIRKEALLEWAKEKYEEYDTAASGFPDDGTYWGQRNAFRQIIDKINSI